MHGIEAVLHSFFVLLGSKFEVSPGDTLLRHCSRRGYPKHAVEPYPLTFLDTISMLLIGVLTLRFSQSEI